MTGERHRDAAGSMALQLTLAHSDSFQSLLEGKVALLEERLSLQEHQCFQVNLILDEICTNIFENNRERENLRIDIDISWKKEKIIIVIEDNGIPFDPTGAIEPDTSLPLSRREAGGLGLYFVKKYTDTFEYTRLKGRNRTSLTKSLESPNTSSPLKTS